MNGKLTPHALPSDHRDAPSPLFWALLACPLWALTAVLQREPSLPTLGALSLAATWTLPATALALSRHSDQRPHELTSVALVCCLLVAPTALLAAWIKVNTNLRPLGAVTLSLCACALALLAWWLTHALSHSNQLRRLQLGVLLALGLTLSVVAAQTHPVMELVTFVTDLASFSLLVGLSVWLGHRRVLPRRTGQSAVFGLWIVCVVGSIWGVDWQRAWESSALLAGPGALLLAG